jgi:predicted AlkP superfamily phosphohydrolase/phosphomutase
VGALHGGCSIGLWGSENRYERGPALSRRAVARYDLLADFPRSKNEIEALMSRDRVLVIGLDGGTLDVIGPLAAAGLMPTFRELIERGRSGILRSTIPWYTIPGWASLMTGVQPQKHGLLYWVASDPSDYFENRRPGRRFVTSRDIPFPTFWDVAGALGKRVAIVNMPLTYPAWPVNGTLITGLLTPADAQNGTCYPEEVLHSFPGYRVDLSASREAASPDAPSNAITERNLPSYLEELIQLTEGRSRVGEALLGEGVDLGVVAFVGPDRISHKAWPEQAALVAGRASGRIGGLVEEYYRVLDGAVGKLIKQAGSGTSVMIVADHGFGPPAQQSFGVNGWLASRGYLHLRAERVQRTFSSQRMLKRLAGPAARMWKRRRGVVGAPLVDWSRSSAYAILYPHTRAFGIVVNQTGAKREGWVGPDEAREVLERLRSELLSLEDDSGRRVIRRIFNTEEKRAESPSFPDLMVETESHFLPKEGLRRAGLFGSIPSVRSGLHDPDGIFILAGPKVQGTGPANADIVDVAPTVLALLGIRAPEYMEGRVLEQFIDLQSLTDPPMTIEGPSGSQAEVSEVERQEIEAHLQALGYVE